MICVFQSVPEDMVDGVGGVGGVGMGGGVVAGDAVSASPQRAPLSPQPRHPRETPPGSIVSPTNYLLLYSQDLFENATPLRVKKIMRLGSI